jgi:hypothetical protein
MRITKKMLSSPAMQRAQLRRAAAEAYPIRRSAPNQYERSVAPTVDELMALAERLRPRRSRLTL